MRDLRCGANIQTNFARNVRDFLMCANFDAMNGDGYICDCTYLSRPRLRDDSLDISKLNNSHNSKKRENTTPYNCQHMTSPPLATVMYEMFLFLDTNQHNYLQCSCFYIHVIIFPKSIIRAFEQKWGTKAYSLVPVTNLKQKKIIAQQ